MLTTLLFTRHGETADNAVKRLSTRPPGPPLSDAGRAQARELARSVADLDITAVYSSPLRRALETAAFVAEPRGLPVHAHDGLRELSVGELEGRSDDAAFAHLDSVWAAWTRESRHDVTAGPGGENAHEVLGRSTAAVAEIVAAERGGTVLVMAHSGVLQVLVPALCANLAPDYGIENWLRNCQLVRVETDGTDPVGMTCRAWGPLTLPDPAAAPLVPERPAPDAAPREGAADAAAPEAR
ncbi:histidine phosphatase family protein [Streptomonospora sp. S1-112]|uniref:Histidine phosphatase family protein n=1 Tax=Streptomonospora mangrovi TaxID=2883123 RepID=A0A9X3NHJ7_9ACTN|nr:histidine phosphatase family protein [Streptomonospora mangrovi]MDA0563797.1 histidine phosphatase family protein [Streptomonospora mangrovi]